MLQLAPQLDSTETLCTELSDGRLQHLAGGPYSMVELGTMACHMAANMFPNGTILASPSNGTEVIHRYPNNVSINQNDYYYMWQRDAGLTMRSLLRVARGGPAVQRQLEAYARLLHQIWSKPSPNGNCAPWGAGDGYCSILGEVKFYPDGSVYDRPWGRHQNDGPAINAMVLIELLEAKASKDPELLVDAKADVVAALKYVGGMGLDSTIDPWEMLYGQHFFVSAIQHRAMAMGAKLAEREAWGGTSNFPLFVPMLRRLVQQHWDADWGAVRETDSRPWFFAVGPKCLSSSDAGANFSSVRTPPCELDMAVLLGALAARGAGQGAAASAMPPHDDRILATAYHLVQSMGPVYEVNALDDAEGLPGVLLGRYPGDEYSGVIMSPAGTEPLCEGYGCGSAWFLTTHGLAEVIYATAEAAAQGKVVLSSLNRDFLLLAMDLALPKALRGKHRAIPGSARELAERLVAGGDGVLLRAKHHAGEGLHMSEQIYRGDGKLPGLRPGAMIGARDLTWSYASLLDAMATRAEAVEALARVAA